QISQPRYKFMNANKDWFLTWPFPKSFAWSYTPLPVRMGYIKNNGIIPSKYGNAELMKIPNFLHLTPNHIKLQCESIKRFCTPWPKGLEKDDICRKFFPLSITVSDYLIDGPLSLNEHSRNVLMKINLSSLSLDKFSREKFVKLSRNYYKKDMLSLELSSCPTRKQNYDHGIFLLTALVTESKKRECWEAERCSNDIDEYIWNFSKSKLNLEKIMKVFVFIYFFFIKTILST
ncbi:hypothetical protein HELRODRAFT_67222, partial [Helobdella robusta]|uniref:Small ribosomal subunit protein mS35 mitochondrial conserved domain-containing protein n=1 Tax=Helobdella robusta TaxID=6412 RepID=T1FYY3_HELRO